MKPFFLLMAAVLAISPAAGQAPVPVIAVPPLATPDDKPTSTGQTTLGLAWSASQLIASDLRSTGEMLAMPPQQKDYYSYPEVTSPSYPKWRAAGAKALLQGFVEARSDGRLTVGCYVYDVEARKELGRTGFVVDADDWRRAAHKCSGLVYKQLTGAPGIFDTRIAYVATTVAGGAASKRIAVMDSDGSEHGYVTAAALHVVSPRLSPNAERLAYVAIGDSGPQVRIVELGDGRESPVPWISGPSFSPRFSPDGTALLVSSVNAGNTDIYVARLNGPGVQRLTTSPGVDTSASFSPDGSQIAFESDRSGSQQIYLMNSDGTNQRRVSFGGGWYSAPAWSPDGERIAFVRRGSDGLNIGIMKPDGSDLKMLTRGGRDESPGWAASSRELIFQRTDAAGRAGLYRVSVNGGEPRRVITPQAAADPDWSGVRE